MKILSVDIGFGDVKVIYGTDDKIEKQFKFISGISVTKKNPYVDDKRILEYKDHFYYVGDDTTRQPSENRIDLKDYKNLEYYAPVLLYRVLETINDFDPDILVVGLSKAQIDNSGYFEEAIKEFKVQGKDIKFKKVVVVPQGSGAKITTDMYGSHFPKLQDEFMGKTTYVGVDLGFNTLDLFYVMNGETSPALFQGLEHEGVMKIAALVAQEILKNHNREIGLHEAKEILDSGYYNLRGQKHDYKEFVETVKKNYLKKLLILIENHYGKILDKCDFVMITGGGSALFKNSDGFIRTPSSNHEFYNAIGQYELGKRFLKS